MKLILAGTGLLMVLIVWWGISLVNGSFCYQMDIKGFTEYTDYTLIMGLQGVLILILIGIFILVNKE